MSSLTNALLAELTDGDLDRLAELLAPRLAGRLEREPAADVWLRGAAAIASYIGAPRSRVYALSSCGRLPVEHDGSALVARRADLDRWLCNGGSRRP